MADSTNQPVVNDVSAPTIEKHTATMASDTDSAQQKPQSDSLVSNNGTTITPNASATAPSDLVPEKPLDTAPSQTDEQRPATSTSPDASITPGPSASPYEASDSLPDMSQKLTTDMTDDMQSPRIYDTKEYVVPIHDTMHSHGTMGKIIAAVVSATVMLAIVIVIAYAVI